MKLKASVLFALRMLKPHPGAITTAGKSLIGAIFCIGLSLIPLVVVLTVSEGMIEGITSRIIDLSSFHIQVNVRPGSSISKSAEELKNLATKISYIDGVTESYPERQGVALAAGSTGRIGATIRCLPPEIFNNETNFSALFTIVEGNLSLSKPNNVLIGTKIASSLNLKVGDTIRLVTFKTGLNGKIIPKITPFQVEGIVSCGYQELDSLWIFVPFDTGYKLLSDSVSNMLVGIQTKDAFSDDLYKTARQVADISPAGCVVRLWNELNTAEFENFSSTRIMLIFIMILIVLVASVNISSALVMLAMERRKEIAILKSMGASTSGIVFSFLITGFCTGLAGIIIGMPIGIFCAINVNEIISFLEYIINFFSKVWYNISVIFSQGQMDFVPIHLLNPTYYLEHIPVVLPFTEFFCIVAGTLILAVIVSIFPSIRAGKEKPVETLRKV